ncbi:MAG TPA: response regulator [Terriglobales bacterium]|nr:response regulator [Terriglobales bacterium]
MKTTSKSILLLISDAVIRSAVRDALEQGGYLVTAVGDLGTAVDRLMESPPDLLIIRSYIEDIPGYDAATYLRTRQPGLKVLMIGGLIDDDRLVNRMTLEGFEVFPKPYPAAALLEKVKEVLEKAR